MVPEVCEAAAPTTGERTHVGAAPALRPLLGICGMFPHSQLYFPVPRNQFHCFTKETSLNVKKPDN